MSILSELNSLLDGLGIPIETGVFSGVPPDEYPCHYSDDRYI